VRFAIPQVRSEARLDGSTILTSPNRSAITSGRWATGWCGGPREPRTAGFSPSAPATIDALGLTHAGLRERLRQALMDLLASSTGSSTIPARLLILEEPPSIDGSEITDKGYINQRATLTRRAALVDELYAGGPSAITV